MKTYEEDRLKSQKAIQFNDRSINAFKQTLIEFQPEQAEMWLLKYKIRILDKLETLESNTLILSGKEKRLFSLILQMLKDEEIYDDLRNQMDGWD